MYNQRSIYTKKPVEIFSFSDMQQNVATEKQIKNDKKSAVYKMLLVI